MRDRDGRCGRIRLLGVQPDEQSGDIKLVNGFYKVKVQNGVVVTLQKSTK